MYKEALITVGKIIEYKEPAKEWKKDILLAEHSPIRALEYRILLNPVKYRTAMHLRTHLVGTWHQELVYISTQRDDRKADTTPRDEKLQSAPVIMVMRANAQAIINMSRKRLCAQADEDTRRVWSAVVNELKKIDKELAEVCVKECLYRGFCPERESCGYTNKAAFINKLLKYRCGGKNGWKKSDSKTKQLTQSRISKIQERKKERKEQRKEEEETPKKVAETTREEGSET